MANKSRIRNLKYYFVAVLGVFSIGITAFELLYDIPMKKCEAAGNWWSWKYRQCAVPRQIVDLTGRKLPEITKTP